MIAISMGDSLGVGPEVIVKALSLGPLRRSARWVILGVPGPFEDAAARADLGNMWATVGHADGFFRGKAPHAPGDVVLLEAAPAAGAALGTTRTATPHAGPREPERASGELSFACVASAIALATLPEGHPFRCTGIVTAPISKQAWALAGHGEFPGHTELFAERFAVREYAMMFHAPPLAPGAETRAASTAGLDVILATIHRPLRTVASVLTPEHISRIIGLGHAAMRQLGVAAPRIGVCGLNPHAGEHGLLGEEDIVVIAPGIAAARAMGIDATGPHPADTIFQRAMRTHNTPAERYDLVVAMYHDQGLIPLKTLAWDRAVNWTVGLPIVRTSPDHGTAFDIAGKNRADPGSMIAAMELAARLAR